MERIREKGKLPGIFLRSLLVSMGCTVILLLILAWILLKFQPDMGMVEKGISVVYALAAFAGGWYSGRKTVQRKFVWGALTGVIYFLLLLAVSGMSPQAFESGISRSVTAFLVCIVAGMFGGMLA